MFSINQSLYEARSCSDCYEMVDGVLMIDENHESNLSPRSMAEAKAMAASNSHKEAERRRRKRINGHIATLKAILPNSIKTDKASLLGEAVRRVRELKKAAAELSDNNDVDSLKRPSFPTETDELKVCHDSGLIKATLCCDDRPEMIFEIIQALKSAEAKVVKAEMSTVGGRTKSVLWVQQVCSSDEESDVSVGRLRRALKMVMDKSTLLAGSGQLLPGHKRPRYYHF